MLGWWWWLGWCFLLVPGALVGALGDMHVGLGGGGRLGWRFLMRWWRRIRLGVMRRSGGVVWRIAWLGWVGWCLQLVSGALVSALGDMHVGLGGGGWLGWRFLMWWWRRIRLGVMRRSGGVVWRSAWLGWVGVACAFSERTAAMPAGWVVAWLRCGALLRRHCLLRLRRCSIHVEWSCLENRLLQPIPVSVVAVDAHHAVAA